MKKIAVLMMLCLASCCPNYSDGSRIGIVTKLSAKGMFIKSWEGEMLIALPIDVAGSTQPELFSFNVDGRAVEAVAAAMKKGKRVELIYRQWAVSPPNIDHDHVVYGVKEVESK